MFFPALAGAQNVTVDGTLSPAQTLAGPNYPITANLGKQVGGNLFHSFGTFGLSKGESATFSGPPNVSNVIGRVTGGTASSIDGAVNSSIGGANVYLINPAGMVLGPNATVNVSGAFHTSTADYVRMSDGAKFQATNPSGSTFSAAPPAAFGFLTASPPALTVNGSQLGPVTGTLGIVGGPVTISNGATLSAPGGKIHVTGVASAGEVPIDPANTAALTVTRLAPVSISGRARLNVSDPVSRGSGGSGGSVFINAGALSIDNSDVNADNYGTGNGGLISLRSGDQLSLSNNAQIHADVLPNGFGTSPAAGSQGTGGQVTLSVGGALSVTGGAQVSSATSGSGNGGTVVVSSGGPLSVSGTGSGIVALATPGATGNAGSVIVTAPQIEVTSGGQIASTTGGTGAGGSVTVTTPGSLVVDGVGIPGTQIAASATGLQSGTGGAVMVSAGSLSLQSGGQIASSSAGLGNGGLINVVASSDIVLRDVGSEINATSLGTGDAGAVTVKALTLSMKNNSAISTEALTSNGGNITINVNDLYVVSDCASSEDGAGAGLAAESGSLVCANAGENHQLCSHIVL